MAGEVSFQLTEKDCVAAYRDWLRHRSSGSVGTPIGQGISAIGLVLLLIVWVISLTMDWPALDRAGVTDFLPFVVAGLACFWILRGFAYLYTLRAARRLFRQRATYQRPLSYGWSEEGLSFRTAHVSGRIPWADLYRWHPAKHSFLFFTDEQMFYFIPRSALSDAEAKDLEATVTASGAPGPLRLEDRLIYA